MSKEKKIANPFPGLRPFEPHENHLFFGRDGQSDELIRRLRRNRFLAVVGTSGSGKSSLVRAGLLPALHGGFMAGAGSHWRIAIFRPGGNPIGNLAEALYKAGASTSEKVAEKQEDLAIGTAITEATLRRSDVGVVEAVKQTGISKDENLLIVVDQFEELFRFKASSDVKDAHNAAAALVKLLLSATTQKRVPIYVVITMRSDYLGDCAQFRDLPEAINDSQYLIPRMTRDQRRQAITGPVAVGGAQITERLVQQLLNDVGDNPDQLPILQHALMRTWDYWHQQQKNNEPIDIDHYEAIGNMQNALSKHADEAFNELAGKKTEKTRVTLQLLAEKLFRCITELGSDNREIRRPTRLKDICEIVDAHENEMIAVINVFRKEGRCFLMPPENTSLNKDSLIDISHESLIRNWERLKKWVKQEAEDCKMYERIVDAADRYYDKKKIGGLWHDPDLQYALDWREKSYITEAWAERYQSGFQLNTVLYFLQKSKQQRDEAIARQKERQRKEEERLQKELKRTRSFTAVITATVVIAIFGAVIALLQRNQARQKTYDANYNLAKIYEGQADVAFANALKNISPTQNFQKTWLYTLQAIKQDIDPAKRLPKSIEKLMMPKIIANTFCELWTTSPPLRSSVNSLAFSPDGKLLASALGSRYGSHDYKDNIRLWDVAQCKQLAILSGYTFVVNSVAFSPDGKLLASASDDRTIRLWDVKKQTELANLTGHTGSVLSVVFSPDGKLLASASDDNTIRFWDAKKQTELVCLTGHTRPVLSVVFSPDGKLLASTSLDSTTRLWEVEQQTELQILTGHTHGVTSVAFSPNGKLLASGSFDRTIRLWDMEQQIELKILTGHTDGVNSVAFSPDGKLLASGSFDQTIRLWDVEQQIKLDSLIGHNSSVTSVTFNPDGKLLASASGDFHGGNINLWDMDKRTELATLTGHTDNVNTVVFSPDCKLLASSLENCYRRKTKCSINLWDLAKRRQLASISGLTSEVYSMAFSPNGKLLALASADSSSTTVDFSRRETNCSINLWDLVKRKRIATLTGHTARVYSIEFSPDGTLLASGSNDQSVRLWDVAKHTELTTFTGHSDHVNIVTFSSDGKILASSSDDQTIRLWNVDKRTELVTLTGHTDYIRSVAFSPDGKLLASASTDFYRQENIGNIWLWDVAQHKKLAKLYGHTDIITSIVFSPDGTLLASASFDSSICLWDVNQRTELLTLTGHTDAVLNVKFSPDGKMLASASYDNSIRLWDINKYTKLTMGLNLANDTMVMFSPDNKFNVMAVAFSHDNKLLASAPNDNKNAFNIQLWDLANRTQMAPLTGHTSDVMSLTFSPDGKQLASGSYDKTIRLWDLAKRKELVSLSGHTKSVGSVVFSPDGELLASASYDRTIRLWDVKKQAELASLIGHTKSVVSVIFSPDGKLLATSSSDNSIRLWDVNKQTELAILTGHTKPVESVVFSPDGKLLASASDDQTIRLWDVDKRKELAPLIRQAGPVFRVVFSPDGKLLASTSNDGMIRLWEIERRIELAVLKGHSNIVFNVTFSPDGKLLFSTSVDGSVKIWNTGILQYFIINGKIAPTFHKIYNASFHLLPFRFAADSLNLELKPELYLTPVGDFEPSYGSKLDHPRPAGKDPIEWMLENMK